MTDTIIDPAPVPPPRIVRRKAKSPGSRLLRLLLIPHALVGVGTLLYTLFLISLVALSVPRKGEVTGKTIRVDDHDSTFLVRFSFEVDGKRYEQSTAVTEEEFNAIHEGQGTTIQVHSWTPGTGPYLSSQNRFGQVIMMVAFSLFWNGILGTFVWMLFIKPARRRWLVVHGIATFGRIVRKELFRRGDGGTAVISYTYPASGGKDMPAQVYSGRMEVQPVESEELKEGDKAIVLYDQDAPERSLLYALSGYEIVPPADH
jgi:hypothetical protein